MRHPDSCLHRRLVTSELCHVEQCSRGTIHVRLGELTLHLRPGDFVAIATALAKASHGVDSPELEATTTTRLLI